MLFRSIVADASQGDVVWLDTATVNDASVRAALAAVPMRAHNAKPLMRWILGQGSEPSPLRLDTVIAAYLLDPADNRYALRDLVERYTPYRLAETEAAASGQLDFSSGPDERQVAAREAIAIAALSNAIEAALEAQGMAHQIGRAHV